MRNMTDLLAAYRVGLGFKPKDVLVPKAGSGAYTFGVIEDTVVVLEQGCLAPHEYTVVGELANPSTPAERFVKFTINGHDWEKVGRA